MRSIRSIIKRALNRCLYKKTCWNTMYFPYLACEACLEEIHPSKTDETIVRCGAKVLFGLPRKLYTCDRIATQVDGNGDGLCAEHAQQLDGEAEDAEQSE